MIYDDIITNNTGCHAVRLTTNSDNLRANIYRVGSGVLNAKGLNTSEELLVTHFNNEDVQVV